MLVRSIGRAELHSPDGTVRKVVFMAKTRAVGGSSGLFSNCGAMTCPRSN